MTVAMANDCLPTLPKLLTKTHVPSALNRNSARSSLLLIAHPPSPALCLLLFFSTFAPSPITFLSLFCPLQLFVLAVGFYASVTASPTCIFLFLLYFIFEKNPIGLCLHSKPLCIVLTPFAALWVMSGSSECVMLPLRRAVLLPFEA
jgi:hypothetical protein